MLSSWFFFIDIKAEDGQKSPVTLYEHLNSKVNCGTINMFILTRWTKQAAEEKNLIKSYCTVFHYKVWDCILSYHLSYYMLLHCNRKYCILLYCVGFYWIKSYPIMFYCIIFYHIASQCVEIFPILLHPAFFLTLGLCCYSLWDNIIDFIWITLKV